MLTTSKLTRRLPGSNRNTLNPMPFGAWSRAVLDALNVDFQLSDDSARALCRSYGQLRRLWHRGKSPSYAAGCVWTHNNYSSEQDR